MIVRRESVTVEKIVFVYSSTKQEVNRQGRIAMESQEPPAFGLLLTRKAIVLGIFLRNKRS